MFGIGLVFFAVGYIGLGLTTNTVAAWMLIGVYGLFTGCTDGVGKAWISSLVGIDLQGSAQGVFQGAQRFRGAGRRLVGGLAVGCRRSSYRCWCRASSVRSFAVVLLTAGLRYGLGTTTSTSSSA